MWGKTRKVLACAECQRYDRERTFPTFFMSTMTDSSSQNNPWFAVSIGLMGLILGFSIASFTGTSFGLRAAGTGNNGAPSVPSVPSVPSAPEAPEAPVPDVSADDHLRGGANAQVTIVEYMDFECPFCHRNSETLKTVVSTYGDKVAHVVRHFPLDFHALAMPYARASECIASLGGNSAFWKFYDAVFVPNGADSMSEAKLPEIAKNIGINAAKFDDCYKSGQFDEKIKAQQAAGVASGVNGTPGIAIVNNATKEQTRLPGAVPFTDYQAAIDAYLGQ